MSGVGRRLVNSVVLDGCKLRLYSLRRLAPLSNVYYGRTAEDEAASAMFKSDLATATSPSKNNVMLELVDHALRRPPLHCFRAKAPYAAGYLRRPTSPQLHDAGLKPDRRKVLVWSEGYPSFIRKAWHWETLPPPPFSTSTPSSAICFSIDGRHEGSCTYCFHTATREAEYDQELGVWLGIFRGAMDLRGEEPPPDKLPTWADDDLPKDILCTSKLTVSLDDKEFLDSNKDCNGIVSGKQFTQFTGMELLYYNANGSGNKCECKGGSTHMMKHKFCDKGNGKDKGVMFHRLPFFTRRTHPMFGSAHRRHLAHIPYDKLFVSKDVVKPISQLMVSNGPWNYGDHEYHRINDYLQKNPILHPVTNGRLIVVDPRQPYITSENGDQLIRSGLVMIKASHDLGANTSGLFTRENVRVLTRMGVLGLKEVNLSIGNQLTTMEKIDNFSEYWEFVKDLIEEMQGVHDFHLLPHDLTDISRSIRNLRNDDTLVELLVNNVGFLPRQSKSILLRRIYNIIMHRIPQLSKNGLHVEGFVPNKGTPTVDVLRLKLLDDMPYCRNDNNNEMWGSVIAHRNEPIFKVWTNQGKMVTSTAEDLLTMLRHGVSHPMEEKMVRAIINLQGARPSLAMDPPTFNEVVDLFDYSFPRLSPRMAQLFWDKKVYNWLKISELFHIPCFYR